MCLAGERWCLGCGRSFFDLGRLAQHIADKHGGINASHGESAYGNGETSGPKQAAGHTLADVAIIVRQRTAARASPAQQAPRPTTLTVAPNSISTHLSSKPHPTSFQPPEGTHAKRRKRPRPLKRGFQLAKAATALEHWRDTLEAIEESLQRTYEVRGAVRNEIQSLREQGDVMHDRNRTIKAELLERQLKLATEKIEELLE